MVPVNFIFIEARQMMGKDNKNNIIRICRVMHVNKTMKQGTRPVPKSKAAIKI